MTGSKALMLGDKVKARTLFRKCVETGVINFTEYDSAKAELKGLEKE